MLSIVNNSWRSAVTFLQARCNNSIHSHFPNTTTVANYLHPSRFSLFRITYQNREEKCQHQIGERHLARPLPRPALKLVSWVADDQKFSRCSWSSLVVIVLVRWFLTRRRARFLFILFRYVYLLFIVDFWVWLFFFIIIVMDININCFIRFVLWSR